MKKVVVIGGGPAGLTAAYELATKEGVQTTVFESSKFLGGISMTYNYKGNRIDIGGHRFFSKSDRVMAWWNKILPIQETSGPTTITYQGKNTVVNSGPEQSPKDEVMLIRSRTSRIYYLRKFFNYPIKLEIQTLRNLGIARIMRIGVTYIWARLRPLKEKSLEEFYINRFGSELYNTFFKSYTEKVWGVPVSQIEPDWGAQRVKGLSVTKTLVNAIFSPLRKFFSPKNDVSQKNVETSLIEYFLYPKFGPGQMWEKVAESFTHEGGVVNLQSHVVKISLRDKKVVSVDVLDNFGKIKTIEADYVISTMPVNELVESLSGINVPDEVREISSSLPFRDFITVGLLVKKLMIGEIDPVTGEKQLVPDNWIYIQEPDVKVGRLQIFNNWSPYLVDNPEHVWIGLEYFVNEGDDIWNKTDEEMIKFGIDELAKIEILDPIDVIDGTVLRVKKTYPAYFGSYKKFSQVREFIDQIPNLYLVGRNGMHRYNNQDHSMLTAMLAAEKIVAGDSDKEEIWNVNLEDDYHEEK